MKTEDTLGQFTDTLILVVGIFSHLEDDFFVKKLRVKTKVFISEYLEVRSREEDANVAQYYEVDKLILGIDDILESLELVNYFGIIKKTTPLLLASQSLLTLKLRFLKIKNDLASNLKKKENNALEVFSSRISSKSQTSSKNIDLSLKNIRPEQELNPNKEKILNFIKKSPNIRTKDIIHEFNALSDRTVKRNLGELLKVGLINKKIENKAVYYTAEN